RVRLVARVLRLSHVLVEVKHVTERAKRRGPVRLSPLLTSGDVASSGDLRIAGTVVGEECQRAKHCFAGVEDGEVVLALRLGTVGVDEAVEAPDCPVGGLGGVPVT